MARPAGTKNIKTPDELMAFFESYIAETKSKPYMVIDWVGKDAHEVQRQKERPLTMEGFNVFIFRQGVMSTLKDYFSNKDARYVDYIPVCTHIRQQIRADQIEGGMAGMYNPSITQRLNNLVEKVEENGKKEISINVKRGDRHKAE